MQKFEKGLRTLKCEDGTWQATEDNWRRQCAEQGWDLDDYAIGALPVIQDLAANPTSKAKVLALFAEDGSCHALCHANVANLPGYQAPVLRVRHLLLSPDYDFGRIGTDGYASALTSTFAGVVSEAFHDMKASHIKFHLRSPADVSFFGAVAKTLSNIPLFETVQMKGAWLYLDLVDMSKVDIGAQQ